MTFLTTLNTKPGSRKKTVIVFGCARGGTSAIAGFLRELGVMFAAGTHPLIHEWSPVAYEGDRVDTDLTRLAVQRMDANGCSWGWKSPRDIWSLQNWIGLIDNPYFVIVYRNPLDTMTSAAHWDSLNLPVIADSIGATMAALGSFIAYTPFPIGLISYEQLCAHPEGYSRDLAEWLELERDDERARNAACFVSRDRRGYRHLHSHGGPDAEARFTDNVSGQKAALQTRLYKASNIQLRGRIECLLEDIEKAKGVVSAISNGVAALSRELVLFRCPGQEPAELENAARAMLESVLGECAGAHLPDPVADSTLPGNATAAEEHEKQAAEMEYLRNWESFSSIFQERTLLQRQMEDLAFQQKCLAAALEVERERREGQRAFVS